MPRWLFGWRGNGAMGLGFRRGEWRVPFHEASKMDVAVVRDFFGRGVIGGGDFRRQARAERRGGIDAGVVPVQPNPKQRMKKPAAKPKGEKTPGTVAVEKYRPKMNKLTDAERERLLAQAMVTIYGQPANADRR